MSHFTSKLTLCLVLAAMIGQVAAPNASAGGFAKAPPIAGEPSEARFELAPPLVDRAQLRAKLLAARKANLARFRAYRLARVYPSNVFTDGLANVWRDQDGHFCAAATIIRMSGQVALVDRIAENDNFIRLADVEQGPVMDWILTSGFTQAELALIQRPFRPVAIRPALDAPARIAVDPQLRARETARLAKRYRAIETKLVRAQRASLELALDRLMTHPDLARELLGS